MKIPIKYNNVEYVGYNYCTEKKVIIGRRNKPLTPLVHKTYRQVTMMLGVIPIQLNYDKVLDKMEEDYQTYLTGIEVLRNSGKI